MNDKADAQGEEGSAGSAGVIYADPTWLQIECDHQWITPFEAMPAECCGECGIIRNAWDEYTSQYNEPLRLLIVALYLSLPIVFIACMFGIVPPKTAFIFSVFNLAVQIALALHTWLAYTRTGLMPRY